MADLPIGYLVTVLLVAWCTWWAVLPRRTPPILASLSFYSGLVINEVPFLALLWLLATTVLAVSEGDISSSAGWATFGLAVVTAVGLVVIAWRGLRAIPVVRDALDDGLGEGWRARSGSTRAAGSQPRFRFAALLGPFFRRRWDVERVADIRYGDAGARNLLDLYRHRSHPQNAPVLIHFHGGAFRSGTKNREALPLLYRLASQGWVCISATYRLGPAATFPTPLIDAKQVIAWVRAHGRDFGADPSAVFVAGASAGAQLAAQAALTPNEATLQPGFEDADTSVAAALTLYGYFGWIGRGPLQQLLTSAPDNDQHARVQAAPLAQIRRTDTPPFFVVHGDHDTVTSVEDARQFVQALRRVSRNPVVYAELPGAQHNFDLFHSIRTEAAIDGFAAFAAWVRAKER